MTYLKFMQIYGEEEVEFNHYYKYIFTFTNKDGLSVSIGGNASDIYRENISRNVVYKVKNFVVVTAYKNKELLYDCDEDEDSDWE